MRKMFPLIFVLLLATHVYAQPEWGTWAAMAYDGETGTIYRMDSNGDTSQFALPVPEGMIQDPPPLVSASRDGRYLAYMSYETEPVLGGGPYNGRLVVFDTTTTTADEYPFTEFNTHSLDYLSTSYTFSPDNTRLAMGYHLPDGWTIATLNLVDQQYERVLSSADPIAAEITEGTTSTFEQPTPVIANFDGQNIEFAMVPGGASQPPDRLTSYLWDTEANTIISTVRYQTLDFDYFLETDEAIEAESNPVLPTAPEAFPDGHNNALTVSTAVRERFSFYGAIDADLYSPVFVENGGKIMFRSLNDEGGESWQVVGRQGGAGGVISAPIDGVNLGISDAVGTQFGALVTADADLVSERLGQTFDGQQIVVHIDTRDNQPLVLEPVLTTPADSGRLTFIWSRTDTSGVSADSFAAWGDALQAINIASAQAAAPPDGEAAVGAGAPPQPAVPDPPQFEAQAAASGDLLAGGVANVTIGSGTLEVRSGPTSAVTVLDTLQNAEQVILLEGPVDVEGQSWWRVRTPRNVEGWTPATVAGTASLAPVASATVSEQGGGAVAPAGGLEVGGTAVVVGTAESAFLVRAEPSADGVQTGTLSGETLVQIIEGPASNGGTTFWRVVAVDGTIGGWMAEANLATPGSTVAVPTTAPLTTTNAGPVPSAIEVGSEATILRTTSNDVNVYTEPNSTSSLVGRLADGSQVTVIDGPQNSGGIAWWRIERADVDVNGWVPGTNLAPPSQLAGGNTGQTATTTTIDPAAPSALSVGVAFVVNLPVDDGVNVRSAPSTNAERITTLIGGTEGEIIGGPQLADGFTWWEVRVDGIATGWAAEAVADQTVLAPAP